MIDPNTFGGWIAAAAAGGMAVYERLNSRRAAAKKEENLEMVSDAKAFRERGDMMAKLADEYRVRLEKEHAEHMAYREWAHTKAGTDQALLSESQNRVMELQARPDLTDLFAHLKTQSETSLQVLQGIHEILQVTKMLVQHLDSKTQ